MGKILSILCLCALGATLLVSTSLAQTKPGNKADWSRIQVLPAGTALSISTQTSRSRCNFQGATPDSLTCAHSGQSVTFRKAEVRVVQVSHRLRSTILSTALGGALAAGIAGAATPADKGQFDFVTKKEVVGVVAAAGAIVAAPIGFFTDFTRSTIYRAN